MRCSYRSDGKNKFHFKAYISHLTEYEVLPSFQGLKTAAKRAKFLHFISKKRREEICYQ